MSDNQSHTAIAIMQCLAAIGDLDARPVIESIANWENRGANKLKVSARARECLKDLDVIQAQARTGAVLRCAADSDPRKQADTLLHGVNESAEIVAAELLRANQIPQVEEAPFFAARSYAVKPASEEVLESKVGGG